mmetsp:Transcript_8227/g.23545  ORF Transcript_8227/g.23545 Transcript_8227/m.23545 type:complete len:303 (+) Transcript_8227:1100-2008(+)
MCRMRGSEAEGFTAALVHEKVRAIGCCVARDCFMRPERRRPIACEWRSAASQLSAVVGDSVAAAGGAAALRASGVRPSLRIIDRCNLTVLLEPGQEDLAQFLANNDVDIIASLPSYEADQTDKQRGRKVFERSILGLRALNELGYGKGGPCGKFGRRLDLVFNPPGPFLPPKQACLEKQYREQLCQKLGVEFNQLITIANMPIKRFFDFLRKKDTLEGYMDLLVRNFNPSTVKHVMCINHVSVSWDGKLYDCDFNQQLEMHIGPGKGLDVFSIETLSDARLRQAPIKTAAHCFGCTAAQGSS